MRKGSVEKKPERVPAPIPAKQIVPLDRFREMSVEMEKAENSMTGGDRTLSAAVSGIIRSLLHAKYSRRINGIPRQHLPQEGEPSERPPRYVKWPSMTPSLGIDNQGGFQIGEAESPPPMPVMEMGHENSPDPDTYTVSVLPILTDDETSCYAFVPPQGFPDPDPGLDPSGEDAGEGDIFAGETVPGKTEGSE